MWLLPIAESDKNSYTTVCHVVPIRINTCVSGLESRPEVNHDPEEDRVVGTDSVAAPGWFPPCASASGRRCSGLVPASPCLERLPPFLRLPPPVWLFEPAPHWPFPSRAKTARSRVATELASSLLLRAAPAEGSL